MTATIWNWPGEHSALEPAGELAELVAGLWWGMFAIAVAVLALVLWLLTHALWRRDPRAPVDERSGWRMVLLAGVALPLVAVIALVVAGQYVTDRGILDETDATAAAASITVTAHTWWWDVDYAWPDGSRAHDANEIHVRTGEPVTIKLRSADVIHALWVPSLGVKLDAIPGADNELTVQVSRPGTYRGVCAELCGTQHAHMALELVAHDPTEFERWLSRTVQPAASERDDAPPSMAGAIATFEGTCGSCHTIAGTDARGIVGPDLTHVGSRRTLAAGTVPNTRGYLGGWILDPQHVKPGAYMPAQDVPADELDALLDYLEQLE